MDFTLRYPQIKLLIEQFSMLSFCNISGRLSGCNVHESLINLLQSAREGPKMAFSLLIWRCAIKLNSRWSKSNVCST